MPAFTLQAVAEYVGAVTNSTFWFQLKAAPGQLMDYLLDRPVMMAVIVVGVMLITLFSKPKPR